MGQERNNEGNLLLTREEWLKRTKGTKGTSNARVRVGRDKSKINCYNCNIYGHYAAEYRRPRRLKKMKHEDAMVQMEDGEPALLLAKHVKGDTGLVLLN